MGAPLIPYIKIPEIPLPFPSPFNSIKPFGLLVATGVYLGSVVAIRRARQRGLDLEKMNTFIFYVVGVGFIGGHVFDAIFYTPDKLAEDPLYILKLWAGLSSYGGFLGAIIGLFLYRWKYKESVIAYADTVCSAFPLAWVFGRMGCATVHDHPGRLTQSFLGVQYGHPDVRNPDAWGFLYDASQAVGRFDLGLIEMTLSLPLAIAFHFLWKSRPRAYGFFPGWMCIAYAPVRFVLDFFRIEAGDPLPEGLDPELLTFGRLLAAEHDPRHLGLTPAQYACFGLFLLGVFLVKFSKQFPAPLSWADVKPYEPPAEDEDEGEAPKKKVSAEAGDAAERRRRRRARAGAKGAPSSEAPSKDETAGAPAEELPPQEKKAGTKRAGATKNKKRSPTPPPEDPSEEPAAKGEEETSKEQKRTPERAAGDEPAGSDE